MADDTTSTKIILRPPEASAYLGLSVSTLAKLRVRGNGPPFVKLGQRAVGYTREALDNFIDARTLASTSAATRFIASGPGPVEAEADDRRPPASLGVWSRRPGF
jgi:predicted DNA-binding transcriptional regulator AlpA